jgi:hypothetical protein
MGVRINVRKIDVHIHVYAQDEVSSNNQAAKQRSKASSKNVVELIVTIIKGLIDIVKALWPSVLIFLATC